MQPDTDKLIQKIIENKATPENFRLLAACIDADESGSLAEQLHEVLQQTGKEKDDMPLLVSEKMVLIDEILAADKVKRQVSIRPFWKYSVAAALLVLVAAPVMWIVTRRSSSSVPHSVASVDVQPGRSGALLTLADGSKILLDTIENRVVALQGGALARVVNGVLAYEANGNEVVYNTISTPNGRIFKLELSDGTRVWLNSASAIRYPTVFKGKERQVDISGEAYFEVAANVHSPFKVLVNNRVEVKVLGTDFNINAYSGENSVNTTLLAGSVIVSASGYTTAVPASAVVLKAGQQAQFVERENSNQPMLHLVDRADVEKVISWKNGLFNFEGMELQEVMRQLERWYDIEVVYTGKPPVIELEGKMTKGVTLQGLMNVLKQLGVETRLEGRKLIVL